jgi:hypothetical protein
VQLKRIVAIACVALLSACSDSNSPNTGLSGTVSFSYSGGTSGSFNASGAVTSTINADNTKSWTVGARDPSGTVFVEAVVPQSGSRYDLIIVSLPMLTTGSANITANCSANSCAAVLVAFGEPVDGNSEAQRTCGLVSGTVAITSISETRAKGTFSGTGFCDASTGASNFTITGGTFDVALLADVPL